MTNSSEVKKVSTNLGLIALAGIAAQFIIISHSYSSEGFDLSLMLKATESLSVISLKILANISIGFIVIGLIQWILVNNPDTLIIGFKTCIAGIFLIFIVLRSCFELPNSITDPLLSINYKAIVGALTSVLLVLVSRAEIETDNPTDENEEQIFGQDLSFSNKLLESCGNEQTKVTVKFAKGSKIERAFLGFREIPVDVISPEIFSPSDASLRLVCATAGVDSKSGETLWFVKAIPIEEIFEQEAKICSYGMIERDITMQGNPSDLKGQIIGPFNTFSEICQWADLYA